MEARELLANIAALKDNLQKYLDTKLSYFGVLAFEKAVRLLALLMGRVAVLAALFFALFFLSGAAAWFLGEIVGSAGIGMLIVGGFYLLLMLVFALLRNSIFGRVAIRILLNIFFQNEPPKKI